MHAGLERGLCCVISSNLGFVLCERVKMARAREFREGVPVWFLCIKEDEGV